MADDVELDIFPSFIIADVGECSVEQEAAEATNPPPAVQEEQFKTGPAPGHGDRYSERVSVPVASESVSGGSFRCDDCHRYVPHKHPLSLAHHAASCLKLPQRKVAASNPVPVGTRNDVVRTIEGPAVHADREGCYRSIVGIPVALRGRAAIGRHSTPWRASLDDARADAERLEASFKLGGLEAVSKSRTELFLHPTGDVSASSASALPVSSTAPKVELENEGDEISVADDLRVISEAIAGLCEPEERAQCEQHLERVRQALRDAAPIATVEADLDALGRLPQLPVPAMLPTAPVAQGAGGVQRTEKARLRRPMRARARTRIHACARMQRMHTHSATRRTHARTLIMQLRVAQRERGKGPTHYEQTATRDATAAEIWHRLASLSRQQRRQLVRHAARAAGFCWFTGKQRVHAGEVVMWARAEGRHLRGAIGAAARQLVAPSAEEAAWHKDELRRYKRARTDEQADNMEVQLWLTT